MDLLIAFNNILNLWRPAFCKEQAFTRAKEHAVASVCAFGRKTITNFALLLRRDESKIVADYKLYSEYKWMATEIFDSNFQEACKLLPKASRYCTVAVDDTVLKKTGKKIVQARYYRDAMGPKFRINLKWGLRFLQFSLTIPYAEGSAPARGIPIRFIDAPSIKKPGKRASVEEMKEYKKKIKEYNLSTIFVAYAKDLRQTLDRFGYVDKTLLFTCDASFCNKTCFRMEMPGVQMIARCRRNIKLCFAAKEGGRRFYGEEKFTPDQVRTDNKISWQTTYRYYGGDCRGIRYKEVSRVLWQNGTQKRFLRLIVIAPVPYTKGGKTHYREPAFLLTTDLDGNVEDLIQAYLDRLQIEYNFRDEKSILGVGEAQLTNERSVEKQPALHVAAYSALLIANLQVYQDKFCEDFTNARWRPAPKRNTCRALVAILRGDILKDPGKVIKLELTHATLVAILSKAA